MPLPPARAPACPPASGRQAALAPQFGLNLTSPHCTDATFSLAATPLITGALQRSLALLRDAAAAAGGAAADAITLLATKPMQLAQYFCTAGRDRASWAHYALAMELYTHFTSPIRCGGGGGGGGFICCLLACCCCLLRRRRCAHSCLAPVLPLGCRLHCATCCRPHHHQRHHQQFTTNSRYPDILVHRLLSAALALKSGAAASPEAALAAEGIPDPT